MFSSFNLLAQKTNPNYDEALAKELKGDDYGMKPYFFVILKTGSNTSNDKELIAEKFRGHLDNINRLVKDGKLVVAGPIAKNEKKEQALLVLWKERSTDRRKLISVPFVIGSILCLTFMVYSLL